MEHIIGRLRESRDEIANELASVTETEWEWTPGDGRWNIQQTVEHLILVERGVLTLIRRVVQAPPTERTEPQTDDQVWEKLTGPGRKPGAAPERVKPSGNWTGRESALAELGRLRDETIRYAEATTDPLRERWFRLPVGELDGAQGLLMLAGHSLRHLDQIRALRVAAAAGAA